MKLIYSYSFSPGNKGNPKYNSANMHPKLHISMLLLYGIPSITSGAL